MNYRFLEIPDMPEKTICDTQDKRDYSSSLYTILLLFFSLLLQFLKFYFFQKMLFYCIIDYNLGTFTA